MRACADKVRKAGRTVFELELANEHGDERLSVGVEGATSTELDADMG